MFMTRSQLLEEMENERINEARQERLKEIKKAAMFICDICPSKVEYEETYYYNSETGEAICENCYNKLTDEEKSEFREVVNYGERW